MAIEIWNVHNCPFFPNQENKKEGTYRPIIVFEDLGEEVLCFPITKQLHQANFYKKTLIIHKDSPEGIQMGLTFDSLIILDKNRFEELRKIRLSNKIGTCPENIQIKIEEMLKEK